MGAPNWKDVIGLGGAGNFASPLEQAGEASDFKDFEIEPARSMLCQEVV